MVGALFAVEHVLDNRLWRDHVLELCQLIGYALPENYWDDPGRPGSYNASHAEKLVAYYIDQHVILPKAYFGADQLGEWIQQDLRLQHLTTLCPTIPTVRASIRVSRAVCNDCKLFVSHIRTILSSVVKVVRAEGRRTSSARAEKLSWCSEGEGDFPVVRGASSGLGAKISSPFLGASLECIHALGARQN